MLPIPLPWARSSLFALLALACAPLPGQSEPPRPPAPDPESPPAVEVPRFPNSTCPIMGKRVSLPLFVDTLRGRFYVCCKPCYRRILADVDTAHKSAYPVTTPVANKLCPVSGEAIGAHAEKLVLQGYEFQLCCAACVPAAQAGSQVTLTKIAREGIRDVGNKTCPITGTAVVDNAFVTIGSDLVRLSSPGCVAAVRKDPAGTLAKAKAIAARQPAPPAHVHVKKAPVEPAPRDEPQPRDEPAPVERREPAPVEQRPEEGR